MTHLNSYYPRNMFITIYKRNKNLKGILARSKCPNHEDCRVRVIISCDICDICRNFMTFDKTFKSTVTGKVY